MTPNELEAFESGYAQGLAEMQSELYKARERENDLIIDSNNQRHNFVMAESQLSEAREENKKLKAQLKLAMAFVPKYTDDAETRNTTTPPTKEE